MAPSSLLAVSPLDGRYARHIQALIPYFSEFALIRYRVLVEIEYLISLADLNLKNCPALPEKAKSDLRNWVKGLDETEAQKVKEIESQINHDVKAVEYLVKEKLEKEGLSAWKEFVHFGLTSQDINNTAIPLLLRESSEAVLLPIIKDLIQTITDFGKKWLDVPMLARTHGQAATPTRFGKEFLVFSERLERQVELLNQVPFMAKFGGATGGFNAHLAAYPQTDWVTFGNQFVKSLGLERAQMTTQIEHYDCLAAYMDGLSRINTIFINFCRDVWQYISMEYLRQKVKAGEVGSSAMPHKVNPIDFENAEGNLGMANAILHHFSSKLPISRLQRDLSDSTVLRNIGVPIGHCMVAYQSIKKGLGKIEIHETALLEDLRLHPEVISEAIQTILRREGFPRPYEALKSLSRTGDRLKLEDIHLFIGNLDISPEVKEELLKLKPETYLGNRPK
jgi:adenylosuccinate lyase